MFMVFSKEKILSYLISLGTVTLLFVMSFAITAKNNETLETSANTISSNQIVNAVQNTNENIKKQIIENKIDNQNCNDINELNCVNNNI